MYAYQHIDGNQFSNEVLNMAVEINLGCGCLDNCYNNDDTCICVNQYSKVYNTSGCLLQFNDPEPIYECNACCTCDVGKCQSRIVQQGCKLPLDVFETRSKGLGLKCQRSIPKGAFVIEYCGEVISNHEACKRARNLPPLASNYILTFKEHFGKSVFSTNIDATTVGNKARFINHSCEPNLVPMPVRINYTLPCIALFTKVDILADEELTFDYGSNIGYRQNSTKPCFCGSEHCRGSLPFDVNAFE